MNWPVAIIVFAVIFGIAGGLATAWVIADKLAKLFGMKAGILWWFFVIATTFGAMAGLTVKVTQVTP